MNELQVIDERELFGNEFKIYGTAENPLFLAKQVAEMIEHSNPSKMLEDAQLDTDEVVKKIIAITYNYGNGLRTRNQEQLFLTEDGLYEVLMQSRKPIAKQFKKEVKNILKTIRKHGAYMTENTIEKALTSPDFLIQLATKLKEEQEARKLAEQKSKELSKVNMVLKCKNTKLKPKADYADEILQSTGTVTTTQIAKDYGMSAKFLNNVLHSLGIQYKVNDQWLLYSKYADKGYVKSCTHVINHTDGTPESKLYTKWTQKGRMFIYEKLKEEGILPVKYENESDC